MVDLAIPTTNFLFSTFVCNKWLTTIIFCFLNKYSSPLLYDTEEWPFPFKTATEVYKLIMLRLSIPHRRKLNGANGRRLEIVQELLQTWNKVWYSCCFLRMNTILCTILGRDNVGEWLNCTRWSWFSSWLTEYH